MTKVLRRVVVLLFALLAVCSCQKDSPVLPDETSFAGETCERYSISHSDMVSKWTTMVCKVAGRDDTAARVAVTTFLNTIINKNVNVAKIEYWTESPQGGLVKASGMVVWPDRVSKFKTYDRIVCVHHGTCDIGDAPSELDYFTPELFPVFSKDREDIIICPDYLGYGSSRTSDMQHPYLSAKYTGTCCADMIEAAEYFVRKKLGFTPSEKTAPIGLCGYSQGGQAAVATLYELQNRGMGSRVVDVKAAAGPHDMDALMEEMVSLKGRKYSNPALIPYLVRGLVYGDQLDVDMKNLFAPEIFQRNAYGKIMAEEFDKTVMSSWNKPLGSDITKIFHQDFFKGEGELNADMEKLLSSARKNSLLNYSKPENPSVVTLYHEPKDNTVPYACSKRASEKWGCTLVDLSLSESNHIVGIIEFMLRYLDDSGKLWEKDSELLKEVI